MGSLVFSFRCGLVPAALLLAATPLAAQDPDHEVEMCTHTTVESVGPPPYLNGVAIAGRTVEIVGDRAKVYLQTRPHCEIVTPPGLRYEWRLIGPTGAELPLPTGTLRPSFTPSAIGTYEAQLTFCPRRCPRVQVGNGVIDIEPQTVSLRFDVFDHFALQLSSQPVLTRSALTPSTRTLVNRSWRERRCGAPGVFYSQLVPVVDWVDAGSYEALEGTVRWSRIAGHDYEFNHDSHDVGMLVVPDPKDERLLVQGAEDMEIEWESNTMPPGMRPLAHDRISAFGFLTLDCHHSGEFGILSEIHPPVLTAVHRARPIEVPDGWAFPGVGSLGSDIFVPGIVTDIWANRLAGEMTRCPATGLHQARNPSSGQAQGPCIRAPHPIRRRYEFNIYLPENPQKVMAAAGITAPPVPLYVEVEPPDPYMSVTPTFDDGHDPHTPQTDDDVWFLHVTFDLPAYVEVYGQYARRIKAAWVLPSADNWGLERWQLGLTALDVLNDHEAVGNPSDIPGDWVFWVGLNNRDREWVQLFDKDDVGLGCHQFDPPWQTEPGDSHGPRSLGPHLLAFAPGRLSGLPAGDQTRSMQLSSSGYEDEYMLSDDPISAIELLLHLDPAALPIGATVERTTTSQDGDYRLRWFVRRVGPVQPARLDPAGQALVDAYDVRGDVPRCTPIRPGVCVVMPSAEVTAWHPILEPSPSEGQGTASWQVHRIFERQQPEVVDVTRVPRDELEREIPTTGTKEPERLEGFVRRLRAEVDAARGTPREAELAHVLPTLQALVPAQLWNARFSDDGGTPADLTVRTVTLAPPKPPAGTPLVVSATVANLGRGEAAPFTVALTVDGNAAGQTKVAALGAGAVATVEFRPWTVAPGAHVVRVEADADHRMAEPVETNNAREVRLTARP